MNDGEKLWENDRGCGPIMLPYAEFDHNVSTDLMSIVASLNLGEGLKEGYDGVEGFMYVLAKVRPGDFQVLLVRRGSHWRVGEFFQAGATLEEAKKRAGRDTQFIREVTKQAGMTAVGGRRARRRTRRRRR